MSERNEQELSKDEALKNTAESAMASKDAIKPAPADSIQFSVIFDDADGLDPEGVDDVDDNASGDIYSIMASAESAADVTEASDATAEDSAGAELSEAEADALASADTSAAATKRNADRVN